MVGRQQRGYQAVTAAPDNALLPACGANFSLQLETAANLLHMRAARRLAWGASGTGRVKASAAVKCRPACSGEGPSRVQPLAAHDRCSGMPIGAAGGAGKDGRPRWEGSWAAVAAERQHTTTPRAPWPAYQQGESVHAARQRRRPQHCSAGLPQRSHTPLTKDRAAPAAGLCGGRRAAEAAQASLRPRSWALMAKCFRPKPTALQGSWKLTRSQNEGMHARHGEGRALIRAGSPPAPAAAAAPAMLLTPFPKSSTCIPVAEPSWSRHT